MPFKIVRNDIAKVKADVIVNTANPDPIVGGGTDSAIYRAAGEELLLAERRKIGKIAQGKAAVTPAFGLQAKYIIHTVGPAWQGGGCGEFEILHSCYRNTLKLAESLKAESIAFPLIATGVYGFPKSEALNIALSEIGGFLLTHEMKITLVVIDKKAVELSGKLVNDIDEYIDEHSADLLLMSEYSRDIDRYRRMEARIPHDEEADLENTVFSGDPFLQPMQAHGDIESFGSAADTSLEDLLNAHEETFQQKLLHLIDESGMDDVTIYKKANIDRKVFSRIRCNINYKPRKKTAVAFAIALRLDMPTMEDLLSRAEIAFSPSNKFDLIIQYFVTHRVYDIYEINAALFRYGQPILGE